MSIKTRRMPAELTGVKNAILQGDLVNVLWNALKWHWDSRLKSKAYCLVGDAGYIKPTRQEAQQLAEGWVKQAAPYSASRYDCDDYAWGFKAYLSDVAVKQQNLPAAYAAGVAWTNTVTGQTVGHAYNWFFTTDDRLWMLEPQTGEIWEFGTRKNHKHYDRNFALVCG